MSRFQVTILVLLGLIACGLLATVGIVGYAFLYQPQQQANTQPNEAASLPEPTEEPTSAPTPTATLIPGWKKFEGNGAELWLPASYDGGNPSEDVAIVIEKLKSLGPDFEQMTRIVEQNKSAYAIWAFDSNLGESGMFLTNVNVTWEQVVSGVTIDVYIDAETRQLPVEFRVVDRQMISLDQYEAGRLFLEFTILGTNGKQVIYVIKEENTVWNVTFTTGADEFDRRLPAFEQSIRTFKVLP